MKAYTVCFMQSSQEGYSLLITPYSSDVIVCCNFSVCSVVVEVTCFMYVMIYSPSLFLLHKTFFAFIHTQTFPPQPSIKSYFSLKLITFSSNMEGLGCRTIILLWMKQEVALALRFLYQVTLFQFFFFFVVLAYFIGIICCLP